MGGGGWSQSSPEAGMGEAHQRPHLAHYGFCRRCGRRVSTSFCRVRINSYALPSGNFCVGLSMRVHLSSDPPFVRATEKLRPLLTSLLTGLGTAFCEWAYRPEQHYMRGPGPKSRKVTRWQSPGPCSPHAFDGQLDAQPGACLIPQVDDRPALGW